MRRKRYFVLTDTNQLRYYRTEDTRQPVSGNIHLNRSVLLLVQNTLYGIHVYIVCMEKLCVIFLFSFSLCAVDVNDETESGDGM